MQKAAELHQNNRTEKALAKDLTVWHIVFNDARFGLRLATGHRRASNGNVRIITMSSSLEMCFQTHYVTRGFNCCGGGYVWGKFVRESRNLEENLHKSVRRLRAFRLTSITRMRSTSASKAYFMSGRERKKTKKLSIGTFFFDNSTAQSSFKPRFPRFDWATEHRGGINRTMQVSHEANEI